MNLEGLILGKCEVIITITVWFYLKDYTRMHGQQNTNFWLYGLKIIEQSNSCTNLGFVIVAG
jgi:hypothetical protein